MIDNCLDVILFVSLCAATLLKNVHKLFSNNTLKLVKSFNNFTIIIGVSIVFHYIHKQIHTNTPPHIKFPPATPPNSQQLVFSVIHNNRRMQKIEVRKEFEFAESNERDEERERESCKPKSIKETRMKEKSERG